MTTAARGRGARVSDPRRSATAVVKLITTRRFDKNNCSTHLVEGLSRMFHFTSKSDDDDNVILL